MAAVHPRVTASLTHLGDVCCARALALWVPAEDRLALIGAWRFEPPLAEAFPRRWGSSAAELRAGRRVQLAEDDVVLPLLGRAGTLLGVLQYVGALPEGGARRIFLGETLAHLVTLLTAHSPAVAETERLLALVPFDLEGDDADLERRTYARMLERCGWDVTDAAALLGVTRQTLYERFRQLELDRPPTRLSHQDAEG